MVPAPEFGIYSAGTGELLNSGDDAKWVPGRVGEDTKAADRALRIVQEPRPEGDDLLMRLLQVRYVFHVEIEVELLRELRVRPARGLQVRGQLEGDPRARAR